MCTSCREGFNLHNKKCIIECPVGMYESRNDNSCHMCGKYCAQCSVPTSCEVCYEGLWLLGGLCAADCPEGYAKALLEQSVTINNRILKICVQC